MSSVIKYVFDARLYCFYKIIKNIILILKLNSSLTQCYCFCKTVKNIILILKLTSALCTVGFALL